MLNDISVFQLKVLLDQASELAAFNTLIKAGRLKPYLKKSEAFRLYGRRNVEHWIDQGFITPRKDGDYSAAWRIDRIEAETLVKALNLLLLL